MTIAMSWMTQKMRLNNAKITINLALGPLLSGMPCAFVLRAGQTKIEGDTELSIRRRISSYKAQIPANIGAQLQKRGCLPRPERFDFSLIGAWLLKRD